jgi:hypothetical protein
LSRSVALACSLRREVSIVVANDQLTPAEVKAMPLEEFEQRFGFRPVDALEKWGWAMQGVRINDMSREMMRVGILDTPSLADIVMN